LEQVVNLKELQIELVIH